MSFFYFLNSITRNKAILFCGVFLFFGLYATKYSRKYFGGNISGLLFVGKAKINCPDAWYPGLYLREDEGFDGEFNYYIALDPFLKNGIYNCTGGSVYRYQRFFLPLIAWAASFEKKEIVPYAILGINLCAIPLGMFFIFRCAETLDLDPRLCLFYAFSVGTLVVLTRCTTEILYGSLLIAGFYFDSIRKEYGKAALFFCLSVWTKEIALAAVLALAFCAIVKNDKKHFMYLLIPLLAFSLWQLTLWRAFGKFSFHSELAHQSATFYPLQGVIAKWISTLRSVHGLEWRGWIEPLVLTNLLFTILLILYSFRKMKDPFPLVALFYVLLLHVAQSVPPELNDLYGYGRQSAELFICLIFLFLFQRKKIFLIPLAVNSLLCIAIIKNYLY